MNTVIVSTGPLRPADVVAVARHGARVELSPEAETEIVASREVIEALAEDDQPHYGISTGFGALATKHIPEARAAAAAQPHPLARGRLGPRGRARSRPRADAAAPVHARHWPHRRAPVSPQTYAAMLNAGITPVVHEYGSLGCSGDLAPLAHCALAAMGEGTVRVGGAEAPAADALAAAGIAPVVLAREGGPGAH